MAKMSIEELLKKQERDRDFAEWRNQRMLDACLMEGVSKGQTFNEFARETQCPITLNYRYQELQKQSGIAPGSVSTDSRPDPFLAGFNKI